MFKAIHEQYILKVVMACKKELVMWRLTNASTYISNLRLGNAGCVIFQIECDGGDTEMQLCCGPPVRLEALVWPSDDDIRADFADVVQNVNRRLLDMTTTCVSDALDIIEAEVEIATQREPESAAEA